MTFTELSAEEQADPEAFLLGAFFSPSESSQSAGREYMKRLDLRTNDRDLPVSKNSAEGQLAAIREWGTIPATGRYRELLRQVRLRFSHSCKVDFDLACGCRHRSPVAAIYRGESASTESVVRLLASTNEGSSEREGGLR